MSQPTSEDMLSIVVMERMTNLFAALNLNPALAVKVCAQFIAINAVRQSDGKEGETRERLIAVKRVIDEEANDLLPKYEEFMRRCDNAERMQGRMMDL